MGGSVCLLRTVRTYPASSGAATRRARVWRGSNLGNCGACIASIMSRNECGQVGSAEVEAGQRASLSG